MCRAGSWSLRALRHESDCGPLVHIFAILTLLWPPYVLGVSQTAALNRGRHLYSAGRPSRWALAHILVFVFTVNSKCVLLCLYSYLLWATISAQYYASPCTCSLLPTDDDDDDDLNSHRILTSLVRTAEPSDGVISMSSSTAALRRSTVITLRSAVKYTISN